MQKNALRRVHFRSKPGELRVADPSAVTNPALGDKGQQRGDLHSGGSAVPADKQESDEERDSVVMERKGVLERDHRGDESQELHLH